MSRSSRQSTIPMNSKLSPYAANAVAQANKPVSWTELKEPIEHCELALASHGVQIWQLCQPATILLPASQIEEYKSLAISTNRDLNELQAQLKTVKELATPRFGHQVHPEELLMMYECGTKVVEITERAQKSLGQDIRRMFDLYTLGIKNHSEKGNK